MTVRSLAALPQPKPAEIIRYGEADSQVVELFLPRTRPDGLMPAVVIVHGGCWRAKVAGRELVRPAAGALAQKGFAVWSVGYRRIDEEGGGFPGTFADVAAAIDLLATQAAERGIDRGRIAFYGHSAGAHLAMWAAGRHRLAKDSVLAASAPLRPRGVVSAGGLLDLQGQAARIRDVCGIDPAESLANPAAKEPFAETSPVDLLPTGVRMTLVHGIYDDIAYPALGLAYAQRARRAGDQAEIFVVPNAGHFEVIAPGTRAFEIVAAALEAFTR
ncbi:alpha/beta hydrolase [Thermaurantiacus sp.]